MKITAYKDVNGKIHDNRNDCEIENLRKDLELESEGKLMFEEINYIIESGKKAQRLKKLYENKQSNP